MLRLPAGLPHNRRPEPIARNDVFLLYLNAFKSYLMRLFKVDVSLILLDPFCLQWRHLFGAV
jgi:hypothetical protein